MHIASYTDETGVCFASGTPSRTAIRVKRRRTLDSSRKAEDEALIKTFLSKSSEFRKSFRAVLSRPSFVLSLRTPAYGRLVAA